MRIIDQLSELGYGPAHFSRGELDSIASTASKLLQGGASLKSALMSAISMTCPSKGLPGSVGSFSSDAPPVADEQPERPHEAPPMPVMDGRDSVTRMTDLLISQPGLEPDALEMLRGVFGLDPAQLQEARSRALRVLAKAEPGRMAAERRRETLASFGSYLDALLTRAAESGLPEDLRKAAEVRDKMKTYYGIGK